MSKTATSGTGELENIFCLLSGENPTLPQAEVEAILESERHPMEASLKLPRMLRFRSTLRGAEAIVRRAAYTRLCCREIFSCEAKEDQILDKARTIQFQKFLNHDETFRVEIVKIEPKASFEEKRIKEKIGQEILDSVSGARVNLVQSDKTFVGAVATKSFILGSVIEGRDSRLSSKKPHSRPFFHPSAMSTKLARCMINLSRASPGSVFLDAFCGTGSHLIEAALMGCTVLGSDIDPRMVKGTLQNLCFLELEKYHLCIADAKAVPFKSIDSCASDPPYGRGSSTHGGDALEIMKDFLENVFDVIASGSYICLAFPEYGNIGELGTDIGYKAQGSHFVREHKSLTREIVVLRRP